MKNISYKFDRHLDENTNFDELPTGDIDTLHLDFSEVRVISSTGIRNFFQWQEKLSPNTLLRFEKCSTTIVTQMNLIEGFLPKNAMVDSFYAPYFCESCDKRVSILFKNGRDFDFETATLLNEIEEQPCIDGKCRSHMDFHKNKYFLFLQMRK